MEITSLGSSWHFVYPYKLQNQLMFLVEKTFIGILSGIVLNQKVSCGRLDVIMVESSNPRTWYNFPCAKVFIVERFIIFSIKVNLFLSNLILGSLPGFQFFHF